MLNVLIKKQASEILSGFFVNKKTGVAKTKKSSIISILVFGILVFGSIAGTVGVIAWLMCQTFCENSLAWLYFVFFSVASVISGVLGSVFTTYFGLYKAKDNDLLLSLPVKTLDIILSRLISVYLMDLVFSLVAYLPAQIVFFIFGTPTFMSVIGTVVLFVIITFIVLILACILGYIVARLSNLLKNKAFVSVFITLAVIGLYYLVYFRLQEFIKDLILNATVHGEGIRENASLLYNFGMIGEGDPLSMLLFTLGTGLLFALTVFMLVISFNKVISESNNFGKTKKKAKDQKQKGILGSLLSKEFLKFSTSTTYMLNCGLGVIIILVMGVLFFVFGNNIQTSLSSLSTIPGFEFAEGIFPVIIALLFLFVNSMVFVTAPSISLEGKNFWLLKSLPIEIKYVLKAKLLLQIILTSIPNLFSSIAVSIVFDMSVADKILLFIYPQMFGLLVAVFGLYLNILKPNFNWSNEMYVVKQSWSSGMSFLGGFGYTVLFGLGYFLISKFIISKVATLYLLAFTLISLILVLILLRWIMTKGVKLFNEM